MRNEYSTSEQEDTKIDMELVIQSLKMLESLCTQKVSNYLIILSYLLSIYSFINSFIYIIFILIFRNLINFVIV